MECARRTGTIKTSSSLFARKPEIEREHAKYISLFFLCCVTKGDKITTLSILKELKRSAILTGLLTDYSFLKANGF